MSQDQGDARSREPLAEPPIVAHAQAPAAALPAGAPMPAYVLQVEFNGRDRIQLNRGELALASPFQKVVAIVAYDEPTEQVQQYAPYTLTVNGVAQPGGTPGT